MFLLTWSWVSYLCLIHAQPCFLRWNHLLVTLSYREKCYISLSATNILCITCLPMWLALLFTMHAKINSQSWEWPTRPISEDRVWLKKIFNHFTALLLYKYLQNIKTNNQTRISTNKWVSPMDKSRDPDLCIIACQKEVHSNFHRKWESSCGQVWNKIQKVSVTSPWTSE